MGAGEDQGSSGKQRQRVAPAEASRPVRERQGRRHRGRAAVGGVEPYGRRSGSRKRLDQQSRGFVAQSAYARGPAGEEETLYAEEADKPSCCNAISSSFRSESKLARCSEALSSTHSTSSTSLS